MGITMLFKNSRKRQTWWVLALHFHITCISKVDLMLCDALSLPSAWGNWEEICWSLGKEMDFSHSSAEESELSSLEGSALPWLALISEPSSVRLWSWNQGCLRQSASSTTVEAPHERSALPRNGFPAPLKSTLWLATAAPSHVLCSTLCSVFWCLLVRMLPLRWVSLLAIPFYHCWWVCFPSTSSGDGECFRKPWPNRAGFNVIRISCKVCMWHGNSWNSYHVL